jgi:ParB-like chromosome segregation protein Spo0J
MIQQAEVPVQDLIVDPFQSRDKAWTGDDLDRRLADSIKDDGMMHDILVRPIDDVDVDLGVTSTTETSDTVDADSDGNTDEKYAIIAGSRRYHAAIEVGQETVSCKILSANDIEAAWRSLSENTERRDLSEQEIASQLNLIYELVRPLSDTEQQADTENGDLDLQQDRFDSEEEALEYIAERFYGRTDNNAIELVQGHLRTAKLPPEIQALFKDSDERSITERDALENYGIDSRTTLGSGEGKSGTSREVVALHDTLEEQLDGDSLDATDAVLDAVGSLRFDAMSEQELRRSLREFRQEVSTALDSTSPESGQQAFRETLQEHTETLRELHEEVEPQRPFKKIDLLGPDTQRHSRWHVQAMRDRGVSSHSELVRELYMERLEVLADNRGWS